VFWDADTFTLPFLAATCPPAARALLEYRLARVPAAQTIARTRHRAGARFPWESARSGFDVTPTFARDRLGHIVPIRTGQLQEHIVAQVPWAAGCYVDWTGDEDFARGPGLVLLVESARYWRSRARSDAAGAAHLYGVIGPDEYHEPVDDNAFTNVMARWNLRRAAAAVESHPGGAGDVDHDEVLAWRDLADDLVDGYDANTGIYEQFAGFHRLEALLIAEVAPRRPVAADVLLGAARVHRAQILKQADVLMMHHLLPQETVPDTLEPNLRFYEPRTAHGSSLSPAIHASLFARARDYVPALESLRLASRIDLDDLTGSSAAGMHIATMGGLWQAMVYGFAGLRPVDGRLRVDPRLPPTWGALEVRVRFRGSRVAVRVQRQEMSVHAEPLAPVIIGGNAHTVGPAGLRLGRRGGGWEVLP
jgi:trehalose/maltose hydrolase-like predicted phosphorylase